MHHDLTWTLSCNCLAIGLAYICTMRPIKILLVEDDEEDIVSTLEAFTESAINCSISFARDGQAALDYLYNRNGFADADKPDFIVLDINLPRLNGLEVMQAIKCDPRLSKIPVFILSTLSSPTQFMKETARMFFTKPNLSSGYLNLIRSIENVWKADPK